MEGEYNKMSLQDEIFDLEREIKGNKIAINSFNIIIKALGELEVEVGKFREENGVLKSAIKIAKEKTNSIKGYRRFEGDTYEGGA